MITVTGDNVYPEILTREALVFLESLHTMFMPIRNEHLTTRAELAQHRRTTGSGLDFPFVTAGVRSADWKCAPIPPDLRDRRVEITGPTDRKMVINALNSGAKVFMADFEDSLSPTWSNVMEGQVNLRDAVRETITYEHPTKGTYKLQDSPAVLMARPRGLHLLEENICVDDEPMSASLVDFGLYFFHNTQALIEKDWSIRWIV